MSAKQLYKQFIDNLSDGKKTLVVKMDQVSGGQKRELEFRAYNLKNIIVLDEQQFS